MFELGARPHPPRTLYRSYLAQSDVFVAIYWQRYGWVAPDMEVSGLEDELVLSAGLPRLVYVKRPAPDMEPRLQQMLARLQDEDSVSYRPFASTAELRDLLVDDLALLLTERFTSAPVEPAPAPMPAQLPRPTSTFVGRAGLLAEIRLLLEGAECRLLTLTGPGGSGKTRLAIEAARAAAAVSPVEVRFVDESESRTADDALATIAAALGLKVDPSGSPLEHLRRLLRDRRLLLVLDNLEQVTEVGPSLVELLETCAWLTVLVTTREALRVTGERIVPVPPLSLPVDDGAGPTAAAVLSSEAGRLFADRAAAVGTGFAVTDANASDVAAVCARLDGLPLAIELAAVQVRLFAMDELRARLEGRLDALAGGARDLPARQRTLSATIEWSHGLLDEGQRLVFRHLSIFPDGRLADMEDVLQQAGLGDVDVVDTVGALVDKNLVRVVAGRAGRPRLSMLQAIREFALERLAGDMRAGRTREAHAVHYTRLAVELHRQLTYADRAEVLAALGEELGNLRAAWQFWLERSDVGRLDALVEPLWGYHEARGDYRAVVELGQGLLRLLAQLPETPERQHDELTLQTNLARTRLVVHGFTQEAEEAMAAALERTPGGADLDRRRFPALRSLATLRLMRGDLSGTASTVEALLDVARREGDPALLSEAHLLTAVTTMWRSDVTEAIDEADRAIAACAATRSGFVEFRLGPNPGVVAHALAGLLRWDAGLAESAVALMERAQRLAVELDHPYSQAYALHHAALIDLARGDLAAVTARASDSIRLSSRHHYPVWQAVALVLRGAAAAGAGRQASGLAELERGLAMYQGLSTPPIFWPQLLMICAGAHAAAGDERRALELLDEADASAQPGDPVAEALALTRGTVLLRRTPPDRGCVPLFRRAAALAGARGARTVQLQALTGLAEALRAGAEDSEEEPQVVAALRALLGRFSEGLDLPHVRAARELLEQR